MYLNMRILIRILEFIANLYILYASSDKCTLQKNNLPNTYTNALIGLNLLFPTIENDICLKVFILLTSALRLRDD